MFAQSNQTEWTESRSIRGPQGYGLPSIDTVMAGCPLSIILGEPQGITMDIIVCYVISLMFYLHSVLNMFFSDILSSAQINLYKGITDNPKV